jgi:NAD(P)-dependent dehydrogenase (short-subunit alcohol dehydrogenase family)
MAKTARSLTGKVAIVTGGGRGIGAATARALAAQGARVAIGDLDPSGSDAALALPLDVTDRPGFTAFLDEVEQQLGPIDVLVNNAGIMPVVRADEEPDATVIRQIEINLHGVIHGTAEAMRRMKPRGAGHIVNIASAAGKSGFPGLATYCATKHGVVGYSEAVRGELRGTGVEISVVMPSLVSTELTSGIKDARGVKRVTPEDVADAIVRAVQFPKFDVFVPRETGAIVKVTGMLPRRLSEGVARLLKADTILLEAAGSPERAAYEARAAASAPAAEKVVEESAA